MDSGPITAFFSRGAQGVGKGGVYGKGEGMYGKGGSGGERDDGREELMK